ncbi:MAG TPA: DUF192 domain-containing protein [Candidatus Nanoarchaeia archaeon]|nr:DUF192 domain-containing protein [Candidatus Nanoarchaeia archaeon]
MRAVRDWVAVLAISALLFTLLSCGGSSTPSFHPVSNSTIALLTSNGPAYVRIEVADTQTAWERGLMGRAELADNAGMLFVFPSEKIHDFWMKDTLIPLDMLFFNSDLKLVNIKHNAPSCKEDPCPTFGSEKSSQYVLEVKSGWAKEHGIKLGDQLQR